MKHSLSTSVFPSFRLLVAAGVTFLLLILGGCMGETAPESSEEPAEEASTTQEMETVPVTVFSGRDSATAQLDLLGTVEANSQVRVFPATSGQVTDVNISEGEQVETGEVLFVLGGAGGTEHPSVTQYKTAKANYDAAVESYKNSVDSAAASVQSAELQLQSAKNQAEGAYIDLYGFSESLQDAKDSIALIRTTLGETQLKNQRDLENLEDAIDDLEDERDETLRDFEEMIDNAPDEATRDQLEDQRDEAEEAIEDQIDALEDQIDALKSGAILAENQILGQLQQAYDQEHSLATTRDSTKARLGLYNGTSDPVLLAEQGVETAKAQSNIALTQARTQLKLAEINLQSASDQQKLLLVKAPVSGVVSSVDAQVGDTISPQLALTEIVGANSFVLNVGVDIENAHKLDLTKDAEVTIGGRSMKVPIQSVAPSADPASRLVNVKVRLPQITFLPNQTIEARLPLNVANGSGSIFVPLDAVTIGTENQFVYVVRDGKARLNNVQLGTIQGDMVEIVDGLDADDQVIVEGAKLVRDGQPVVIQ